LNQRSNSPDYSTVVETPKLMMKQMGGIVTMLQRISRKNLKPQQVRLEWHQEELGE
jgi:hypothetical protein